MTTQRINTKAIIIGAGPAGVSTSLFLTKYQIPHVLIEKATFPRDKVCGDGCTIKTVQVLQKLNPLWLQELLHAEERSIPSYGVKVVAPNGKMLDIPFKPDVKKEQQAPGFIVPRLVFDNFIFQKLTADYTTLFQNSSLKCIEREANGNIKVNFTQKDNQYEVSAPLVIGADGDKSTVRKYFLNEDQLSKAYSVGLRAYYKGVTGLHSDNFMELHFLKDLLPGYFWIFPLPNGMANVGIGMPSAIIRKHKMNLREEMLHIIKSHTSISLRFANATLVDNIQGWGIPMHLKPHRISGDNFILTGDAANLVDPFSGEGIGNALHSGMLAASAIKKALQANQYHSEFLKKNYDAVLYNDLGNELKVSGILHRFCHHPWILNFIANKVFKKPSRIKTISSMFTDMNLRYELKKPSFYFKVLLK